MIIFFFYLLILFINLRNAEKKRSIVVYRESFPVPWSRNGGHESFPYYRRYTNENSGHTEWRKRSFI